MRFKCRRGELPIGSYPKRLAREVAYSSLPWRTSSVGQGPRVEMIHRCAQAATLCPFCQTRTLTSKGRKDSGSMRWDPPGDAE